MTMNGKKWIVLLLTASCALFSPRTVMAAPEQKDLSGKYTFADEFKNYGEIIIQKSGQDTYFVEITAGVHGRAALSYFYGTGKYLGEGILSVSNTLTCKEKSIDLAIKIYLKDHKDLAHLNPQLNWNAAYRNLKPGQIAIYHDKKWRQFVDECFPVPAGQYDDPPQPDIRLPNGKFMFEGDGSAFSGVYTKAKAATGVPAAHQAAPRSEMPKPSPMPSRHNAPSFNCAKASNAVERTICAEPALADLDLSMAAEYKKAISLTAHKDRLRANQRQWLKDVHSQCAHGAFQCIQQNYGTRLSQLKQRNEQAAK